MLFLRALLAFLVLPAVVAGIVPLALLPEDRWRVQGTFAGWPVLGFSSSSFAFMTSTYIGFRTNL
jgi:hypothetical protein